MKQDLLFNTPLEIGLRCMFLLKSLYPLKADLDRLVYLDYLTIYTNNSRIQVESLHPEYAMRNIELFSKREILKKSLMYMASKGLIIIKFDDDGINYCANGSTNWFLDGMMESEYSKKLLKSTEIIIDTFKDYSNDDIKKFFESNIQYMETEFNNFFPYKERGI